MDKFDGELDNNSFSYQEDPGDLEQDIFFFSDDEETRPRTEGQDAATCGPT